MQGLSDCIPLSTYFLDHPGDNFLHFYLELITVNEMTVFRKAISQTVMAIVRHPAIKIQMNHVSK
jgi:hypothetical protein